ncbi:MAG: FG-GAP repeat domain-containing protein [Planctomycetota bacterium]
MAPTKRYLFTFLSLLVGGSAFAQGHDRWHQTFRIEIRNQVVSNDWVNLDLADLNGDGQPELLYADPYWHAGGARGETGRVMIRDGADGTLLFQQLGLQSYARYGTKARFIDDIDGDGVTDFVVTDQRSFNDYLYLYSGATFQRINREFGFPDFIDVISVGDHTGDGITELVAVRSNYAVGPALEMLDGATGDVLKRRELEDVSYSLARLGDLDGDGHPEIGFFRSFILWGDEESSILRGTNLRPLPLFSGEVGRSTRIADAGDVDGDGVPDILAGDQYFDHAGIDGSGIAKVVSGTDGSLLALHYGAASDFVGSILGKLGDVDGDGFGDYMIGSSRMTYDYGYGNHAGSVAIISGATHTEQSRFYAQADNAHSARMVVASPATATDGPTFGVVEPTYSIFQPMITRLSLFTYGQ